MTKNEVIIGAIYLIKKNGKTIPVKILEKIKKRDTKGSYRGFLSKNLINDKDVVIKSASKLRREVTQEQVQKLLSANIL